MFTRTHRLMAFIGLAAVVFVACMPLPAYATTPAGEAGVLSAVRSVKGVEIGSRGATLSVDVAGKARPIAVAFSSFVPAGVGGSMASDDRGRMVTGALTLAALVLAFGWLRRMLSVFLRVGHGKMR